ncbi:MAG: hypothetical protein JSR77_14055 [Planctomycetes bacterium]|nr:hypothetical protein [Planctomycetota bacterium]
MFRNETGFRRCAFVAAVLVSACGQAFGAAEADKAGLLARYPGLNVIEWDGRPEMFYGVPMTVANDPRIAADTWLSNHGSAFGAGDLTIRYESEAEIAGGRFTAFHYSQLIDGLPVDLSQIVIVVLNAPDGQKVVSAAAKVATPPQDGFRPDGVTADDAVAKVRAMGDYNKMPLWSAPEMVVYMGEGDFPRWITPTRAWKFVGNEPNGADSRKYTFFVDASSGELIFARDEILHIDVVGQVRARATPSPDGNAAADWSGNPPAERPVPNIRVRINGSNTTSAFTDANGNFTIPYAGTGAVTIDCSVGDGRWARVVENNAGVALITASTTATPGVPATLLLNPAPSTEFTNAQANAFIQQTLTHNFIRDRVPTFAPLDTQLPCNTGVTGSCNAFYDGASTNFYNLSTANGCNNTAFSSVVSHEYGHHIVNRRGLAQGGFGEGYGDCVSILEYDDPIVGRYFRTSGAPVRTPDTTNRQYPCTAGEVHACGEIIAGAITKLRRNFGNTFGSAEGLTRSRQLFVDWTMVTLGGEAGMQSAVPRTVAEFLTINDDDGNLSNGTPQACEIANAFNQHNVQLTNASQDSVVFALAQPLVQEMRPGVGIPVDFTVQPLCRHDAPNSGRVFYRVGASGAYSQIALTQVSPGRYVGEVPAQQCGASGTASIQYYFAVNTLNNGTNTAGPTAYYPPAGTSFAPVTAYVFSTSTDMNDDFEADRGWTVGTTTATTGQWVRGDPVGTIAQPEDDHSASGSQCFFTGQGALGGADGAFDIDGGMTTLLSPTYNMAGADDVMVTYWRWYSNGAGAGPYEDTFRVDVSVDGGTNWTNAETIGPGNAADPNVNGGWVQARWLLRSKGLAPSSQIKLRFIAEDAVNGSLVEAALDDFSIRGLACSNPVPCIADFDNNGGVDGADVEAFFVTWTSGDSAADVNQDGGVDGGDVATFFIAWQAGGC